MEKTDNLEASQPQTVDTPSRPPRKWLTFSIAKLVVDDYNEPFSLSDFLPINDIEDWISSEKENNEHVTFIRTQSINDRFFFIHFQEGNSKPRPEKVYNYEKKSEEDNPRKEHQIEMDTQTFVLIDPETHKIYISNLTKKTKIKIWLKEKIKKIIDIKSVVIEEDFLKNLKILSTIQIAADRNLISFSSGDLSEILKYDVYEYGTNIKKLNVEIEFEDVSILEKTKTKIMGLIKQQKQRKLDKLVIVGRTDENFERVFNMDGIVDRTEINAKINKDGMFNEQDVFNLLIKIITQT